MMAFRATRSSLSTPRKMQLIAILIVGVLVMVLIMMVIPALAIMAVIGVLHAWWDVIPTISFGYALAIAVIFAVAKLVTKGFSELYEKM